MKTVSRILAGTVAALSLSLAPALAFADETPAKPPRHADGGTCDCRHDGDRGQRGASATSPEESYDAPAWVRYMWSSP